MKQKHSQHVTGSASALFDQNELVFPNNAELQTVFSDDIWDIRHIRKRPTEQTATLNFSGVPDSSRQLVKEVVMAVLNPHHRALQGLRWIPPKLTTNVLDSLLIRLRQLAVWCDEHQKGICGLTEQDTTRLLSHWTAKGYAPTTVAINIDSLRLIRDFGPLLDGGGISFDPWPNRSSSSIAGLVHSTVNKTAPLPWELWASLIDGAYRIVNDYSTDIINADSTRREQAARRHTGPVSNAEELFDTWVAHGGRVPLRTGLISRGLQRERGTVNLGLLAGQVGIYENCLRERQHIARLGIIAQVERMAKDPEHSCFGGLHQPVCLTPTGDLWVDEIGLAESEYLTSVLRGACYVIVVGLTGMRDSEVQFLKRGAVTESFGSPALRSAQFKGIRHPDGKQRAWWAPQPAVRAIEVLEQLSINPEFLLSRSQEGMGSGSAPSTDIRRLLGFLSAEPNDRPGRGSELGHDRVCLVSSFTRPGEGTPIVEINQRSLRQSYALYTASKPGAELGLGIQLGHVALSQTFAYATDPSETAVKILGSQTSQALNARAKFLANGPLAGTGGERIASMVRVLSDEQEAESFIQHVAENLHPGVVNDCMFNSAQAPLACKNGPQLHNHNCATAGCKNCVVGPMHVPVWIAHRKKLDAQIPKTRNVHLSERLIEQRRIVGKILANFDTTEDS